MKVYILSWYNPSYSENTMTRHSKTNERRLEQRDLFLLFCG